MGFDFKKLEVYKNGREFIKQIYKITEKFPKHELYGIVNQLRRASVSVNANIAEGSGRRSKNEQRQFYYISRASLYECIALIDIAYDLNFINDEIYTILKEKPEKILARLNGLIKYTNR